jgi:hypothetical protein
MPKLVLTMVCLVFCWIAYQMPSTSPDSTAKIAGGRSSATTALIYDQSKTSIGIRWTAGSERNRVMFTPAPGFFVLVGLSLASCLALPLVHLAKAD